MLSLLAENNIKAAHWMDNKSLICKCAFLGAILGFFVHML